MIYGVVGGTATRRVLLNEDLEVLRRLNSLLRRATQPEEARIEGSDVLLEDLGRVAFRIGCDEQHLYLVGLRPQLFHGGGELGHRSRTNIGAMRITEEHDHHFAAKIRKPVRLSVEIGELQ